MEEAYLGRNLKMLERAAGDAGVGDRDRLCFRRRKTIKKAMRMPSTRAPITPPTTAPIGTELECDCDCWLVSAPDEADGDPLDEIVALLLEEPDEAIGGDVEKTDEGPVSTPFVLVCEVSVRTSLLLDGVKTVLELVEGDGVLIGVVDVLKLARG